jgi:hypothetical protein
LLADAHMATIRKAVADYAKVLLEALPDLETQAAYMADLAEGQEKFAYMSLAGVQAVADAVELAEGGIRLVQDAQGQTFEAPGMGAEARQLMVERCITDAEMAAIKIYTAPDYRYITAGLAKNRGAWLSSAIRPAESGARSGENSILGAPLAPGRQGPLSPADMAASEGTRHGKHAVEGLKKLPPWKGETYRGMGLTEAEFQDQFVANKVWKAASFTSTSTRKDVSTGFAKNEGTGGKVAILLTFHVTNGRDIKDLSIYSGEGEILLLPGATARVERVVTERASDGSEIRVVHLGQTS